MTLTSVVVVGAGIGGITAATHLARAGLRVTVLEKNERPGGRCGLLAREGHRFDIGPTLFVMPRLYEAEFRALGTSLKERLDLRRVDPTYRLVFDDGSHLSLTSQMASMREQLEAIEPGSFARLRSYVEEGGRHYDLVVEKMVNRAFRGLSDLLSVQLLRLFLGTKPLSNHYRHVAGYFAAPRLKSAFTFNDLYVGLSPFDAPATLSFLPYTELAHGVWYPRGGMYAIVETLVDLARDAGVEFRFGATVTRIDTSANRARGVVLANETRVAADVVLANADLPWVYRHLLPIDRTAESLSRKRFSCSTISFFWGVDRTYSALPPHTLFLADDYRENFESITRDHTLHANPSLYVHAPGRLETSVAPPGHDSITAIVPVGHLTDDRGQDWDDLKERAREHVFRRLRAVGVTDIAARIKFEEAQTPVTWAAQHNLAKGATHGLSHTLTQMACFRPANRHRRYRNLYFAGASTHPGTGVPTAMVSGRLAAERITADLR
jgi:phytoene desaturase (3,4-didehydrolycopene-forming)